MKQIIIFHGSPDKEEFYNTATPSPSNSHFIPWLQKQLGLKDLASIAPELPRPYDPQYYEWESIVKQFDINNSTVLVGHSSGAGFLLRYLSENIGITLRHLVLVAPWIDNNDPDFPLTDNFFDFKIDSMLASRMKISIMADTSDNASVAHSCEKIIGSIPGLEIYRYNRGDHFCCTQLPELLEIVLESK